MNDILSVSGLCKRYPEFSLRDVSFSVPAGSLTGFIGRNGAGKTTTLKSVLGLVHPDAGEISFFGLSPAENEAQIKQSIGYSGGAVNYYKKKKLSKIAGITKSFYKTWDDGAWKKYLRIFNLDENKTPDMLSEGMKVKFNIALSLSHHARLLILDEPTSGLDPVSREEFLEILLSLKEEGVSVLFSTHITSDLDRCADRIIYIKNGEILACDKTESFTDSYRTVRLDTSLANVEHILGKCKTKDGETGLIKSSDVPLFPADAVSVPTLEEIMVHLEKEVQK